MQLMMNNNLAFTSEIVKEFCDLFGVKKVQTSTYHPQCNGSIERQHQTLPGSEGQLAKTPARSHPSIQWNMFCYQGIQPALPLIWVPP